MNVEPETERERLLQNALRKSEAQEEHQQARLVEMQASLVLVQKYCDRVRNQLETQEKKAKKKGKGKNKRLHGDGMPRLLTSDEFFSWVDRAAKLQQQEAAAKEARAGQKVEHQKALADWKG